MIIILNLSTNNEWRSPLLILPINTSASVFKRITEEKISNQYAAETLTSKTKILLKFNQVFQYKGHFSNIKITIRLVSKF